MLSRDQLFSHYLRTLSREQRFSQFYLWTPSREQPFSDAGKCWMDALELTLRCSSLLMRSMVKDVRGTRSEEPTGEEEEEEEHPSGLSEDTLHQPLSQEMNESDCERHFKGYGACFLYIKLRSSRDWYFTLFVCLSVSQSFASVSSFGQLLCYADKRIANKQTV